MIAAGANQYFVLATAVVLTFSILGTEAQTTTGLKSESLRDESFEDRVQRYTDWARFTSKRGRRLSDAYSPLTAPSPPAPPTYGSPPPYGSPQSPPSGPGSPPPSLGSPPPSPGSGGGYGCKVLRYHTGFANTTLYYDKIVPNTPNFGECCKICQADDKCQAWTRVAGGDPANFRNCYLKYSLTALDQSPARLLNNHEGHTGDSLTYPELRYVNEGYPSAATPLILESGTVPDYYPADYYGCPYAPGNPTTPCQAPPTCNVDGNGVFVAPPCIQ